MRSFLRSRRETRCGTRNRTALRRRHISFPSCCRVASWALVVCAVLLVVSMVGVDVRPLLVLTGGGGVVAGLASQQLLSNAVSGLQMYMDRPFRVGDTIAVTIGMFGQVGRAGQWMRMAVEARVGRGKCGAVQGWMALRATHAADPASNPCISTHPLHRCHDARGGGGGGGGAAHTPGAGCERGEDARAVACWVPVFHNAQVAYMSCTWAAGTIPTLPLHPMR